VKPFLNEANAKRALLANLSPRFMRLDRLERYVLGTQYEGRASFYDQDTPVNDRAPCIVYSIVSSAIRSNVDLCLGEGRFPELTSYVDEDDSSFDVDVGLNEEDSELMDRGVRAMVEQSRLPSVAKELLAASMGCGTAVAICSIRNGKLRIDTTKAKWCTPTFDSLNPDEVESLEIRYPYLVEYYDEIAKQWGLRCMIYRRVIDEVSDVTFRPAAADDSWVDPDNIVWTRDDEKSVDHGLGFCPVVWYKLLPDCSSVADYDGTAVHAHLLDELDALNMALSQRHVASLIAASPPTIEIGVDDDVNPSPMGMSSSSIYLVGEWTHATSQMPDHPGNKSWGGGHQPKMVRKRGPGIIWRYPNPLSKVQQLTLPGDALKPVDDNCRDLRAKIAEALSVTFTDIENQRTTLDVSGRALRELHKRQIERCDSFRDDFGDNCLLRVVDVLVRLVLSKKDSELRVPGVKKIRPILERFNIDVAGEGGDSDVETEWSPPKLDLIWGEYFAPSEVDQKAVVDAVIEALDAKLITKRTAVQRLAGFYDIENVDQYLDTLEKQAQADQVTAIKNQQDMIKSGGVMQPATPPTPTNGKPAAPVAKPTPFGGQPKTSAS
jgi:hypothetical protein